MRTKTLAVALASAVLATTAAHAAQIQFTALEAHWQDTVGGTNVAFTPSPQGTFGDPATVSWGTGGTSSYAFDAYHLLPLTVNDGVVFDLGTFAHDNQTLDSGTSITGTTLNLRASLRADSGAGFVDVGTYNFLFDFTHRETTNKVSPCADGGPYGVGVNVNGCADRVTFETSSLSETFQVGDLVYTLQLAGFCADGGCMVPLAEIWTKERFTNTAVLKASFDVAAVSLPGAVWLFASALVGFAGLSRRRWNIPV